MDLGLIGRVALVTGASRGIGRATPAARRASPDPLAISANEWELAHRTLVVSPMLLMRRLVPGMRSRGFGRVVAVSSDGSRASRSRGCSSPTPTAPGYSRR